MYLNFEEKIIVDFGVQILFSFSHLHLLVRMSALSLDGPTIRCLCGFSPVLCGTDKYIVSTGKYIDKMFIDV